MTAILDIEQRAESFLAHIPSFLWDEQRLPVPIEDIADSHAGLLVRDMEDLSAAPGAPTSADGRSLSGLLLPLMGEIWVSAAEARDSPARRRFTIAHELGHWCLHRDVERSLFCRATAVDPAEPEDEAEPQPVSIEHEANAFAAALLMPPALVREQYSKHGRDFWQLCETFNVSGAAMGRRLHAVIAPRHVSQNTSSEAAVTRRLKPP